ncbi:MAG: hypothetical protein ACRD2S_00005, partial [Terriglobales bacterium]
MNNTALLQVTSGNVKATGSKILLFKPGVLLPLVMALACWLPSQSVAAQQNNSAPDTTSASQNRTAATKPHDNTFVIGA